ncbi:MAG: hypothetical protein KF764_32885 [Labilithrix sp.]|nr:hypothetical protein [Labilithrix sp.]MBX3220357.1 hypothetical protein [Labilithrix sp.]
MSIVATASVSGFFEEMVDDALKSRGVNASEGARSYVVALLADLAKPGSPIERTLERPLTLLLDEALKTPERGERFERLRTLGDGVLYSSGFFADHFEARGVDTSYLIGIGRTAYDSAGSLIRTRASDENKFDLFAELSEGFASFVDVIGEVANATIASGVATSRGLVKLYERWLKTRSDKLADALSSHGFVARPAFAGAAPAADRNPAAPLDGGLTTRSRGRVLS